MRVVAIIFLCFLSLVLSAQDTLTIDRLDYRFVSFEDGQFSPLVSLESADVAGVFVPCTQDAQVEFCGDTPFDIWVDGRMLRRSDKRGCEFLKMEELCAFADRDTVFISLVSNARLGDIRVRTFRIVENTRSNLFYVSRRDWLNDFWLLGFLLCGFLIAGMKYVLPKQKTKLWRPNFEQANYRLTAVDNWILLLIACFINAFAWSYLGSERTPILFFAVFGVVLSIVAIKFVVTMFSASIFKFEKSSRWQFIFFIRFWSILSVIAFLFMMIVMLFPRLQVFDRSNFELIASIFIGLFMLIESFIFMSGSRAKSLHIFVYLCCTEIIPTCLVIYWFLV